MLLNTSKRRFKKVVVLAAAYVVSCCRSYLLCCICCKTLASAGYKQTQGSHCKSNLEKNNGRQLIVPTCCFVFIFAWCVCMHERQLIVPTCLCVCTKGSSLCPHAVLYLYLLGVCVYACMSVWAR